MPDRAPRICQDRPVDTGWGSTVAIVVIGALIVLAVGWWLLRPRTRPQFVTDRERATYATLHTASVAARHLRGGLAPTEARRAVGPLRELLGTPALALVDRSGLLAWEGAAEDHATQVVDIATSALDTGEVRAVDLPACGDPTCFLRSAVVAPVVAGDRVVAALVAPAPESTPGLTRATEEVADWVATQVDLADLSRQRTRTMEAELRALRAQISPHFIYNSLGAIASFVRTDPDRARELLLEFADFSRYALREGGTFTTLAEELRNVERYLVLEQARFGDRLTVSLKVAPEVLPIRVPFLAIQPLVENAVQHGIAPKESGGRIEIVARDVGTEAEISIDDNGVGADPAVIRQVLDGGADGQDSVGLGNVDARLRQVYGDDLGLVVETAPEAGMRVTFRLPKFAPAALDRP
ncbi:histidine kinase [Calidifontibacter sp. DB0510]|uniref:Histidine kinase n=1 Tax=Metallococcus carri TaxID=1656884 RepID=A0A967B338_9MICO|nr:histidine kinase [Metallococcus carri]NHN56395.1 histidine kinase [Metallococcus carri]NOP36019.1 histidine kinase [Calidifontibacter sp. DB2511S]